MSCCGQAKDGSEDTANRSVAVGQPGYVNQQPGPQLGLEKQVFQQPNIPSPPPVHPNGQNGFSQQPSWGSQPSPSPPPAGAGSPFMSNGNGYPGSMNEAIQRPGSAHQSSFGPGSRMSMTASPMLSSPLPTMPPSTSPPLDEGKMSVSIDFGVQQQSVLYGILLT